MTRRYFAMMLFFYTVAARGETVTTLTSGFDYSTGNYGNSYSTSILYVPVTLKMLFDQSYVKLTVPYISISNGGLSGKMPPGVGVIPGVGPVKKTGTSASTSSGLGDITAAYGYTVYEDDALALDAVGIVKFGTADAGQNLGTGENDYSAQLDSFYTISKTTWFATLGYKVVGVPAGSTLHNIFYGTLGISQKVSDVYSAGAMVNTAQSTSDVAPGILDVTMFVAKKTSKTGKVQFSLLKGFSDASPDIGINLMFTGGL